MEEDPAPERPPPARSPQAAEDAPPAANVNAIKRYGFECFRLKKVAVSLSRTGTTFRRLFTLSDSSRSNPWPTPEDDTIDIDDLLPPAPLVFTDVSLAFSIPNSFFLFSHE